MNKRLEHKRNMRHAIATWSTSIALVAILMVPGPASASGTGVNVATANVEGFQKGVGVAVDDGGSAAGSFSFDCYGSLPAIALDGSGGGCAVAAAFAADVQITKWFWTFEASIAVSGCGGVMTDVLAIEGHVACNSTAISSFGPAYADCTDGPALLKTFPAMGCASVTASFADDVCAEADSVGHASNGIAGINTAEATASAASAGCSDAALALVSAAGGVDLSGGERLAEEEVEDEVITELRSALKSEILDAFDDATVELSPEDPVYELVDQLRVGFDESLTNMEFGTILQQRAE